MDVVLYMRYSSDRQTEQSIEGQQRVCTEFCKAQGYNIVGKYIDRATSAFKDTSKRVSFNKMIKDSDRQQWQAVVVYKLDRFARNRYDSATYKSRLKKNGVKVISATENISDNPEGIILEAVLEGMAEFYSKELSQKINRGMTETAYKGNSCGGQIPLGYKVVNKKLVIDEPNAEIVKESFARYANGESVADICEKCDMNRKSFYYHFKYKYDLVNWIFDTEFIAVAVKKDYDNYWDRVAGICQYFYTNHNFYRKVLNVSGQNSFYDHFSEVVRPAIAYRMEGVFFSDKARELQANFFSDALVMAVQRWLQDKEPMPVGEFVEQVRLCMQLFLDRLNQLKEENVI